MDELKLLIEMVAHLPTMAMWALIGFYTYKVMIIGSIYGVIRFIVSKAADVLMRPKSYKVGSTCINETTRTELELQVQRLSTGRHNYIHSVDVARLRKLLDDNPVIEK